MGSRYRPQIVSRRQCGERPATGQCSVPPRKTDDCGNQHCDVVTPAAPAAKAAQRAPRGELRRYTGTHCEPCLDPQVKADHVEFLRRVVPGVAAPS